MTSTVLVVEDDVQTAHLFRVVVEQANLRPEVVYSGQEALEWIEKQGGPDAVILDMHLPGVVSGAEVFKALRTRTKARIIVSSADHRLAKAYLGVADAVNFKPVGLSDMVATLAGFMARA